MGTLFSQSAASAAEVRGVFAVKLVELSRTSILEKNTFLLLFLLHWFAERQLRERDQLMAMIWQQLLVLTAFFYKKCRKCLGFWETGDDQAVTEGSLRQDADPTKYCLGCEYEFKAKIQRNLHLIFYHAGFGTDNTICL